MNWNKVKTYLIVSLLFVNILFVASISLDFYRYRNSSRTSPELEQHLQAYLNRKQIVLKASLEEFNDTMAPIDISYPKLSEENYPKLFEDYPMYTKIHQNKKLSINLPLAMVIKKDGRREPFDRKKLEKGIERALEKRPVSLNSIENIVTEIEDQAILSSGLNKEIETTVLGEMVLSHLYSIDKVAYIRFASVYKQFSNLDEFVNEVKKVRK